MKNSALALLLLAGLVAGCSNSAKSAAAQAPATGSYQVLMNTSKGPVLIDVDRHLAPIGAQRFYDLVRAHYFDGERFFRVVPGFVVQWGEAADPKVTQKWNVTIPDDPVKTSNTRGTVAFAASDQPNSRTAQLFINLGDNAKLDSMGFAPIGRVVKGMNVVDNINPEYGEAPNQNAMAEEGNAYLQKNFPRLDYIKSARVVTESP